MSYAGPAARTNRAPDAAPPGAARPFAGARPAAANLHGPRNASSSDDRRGPALFAAGVAHGVVDGASVALLFAPQAGEDTRRAIARRGQRFGRRSHDAWDDLRLEFRRALRRRMNSRSRKREDRPTSVR